MTVSYVSRRCMYPPVHFPHSQANLTMLLACLKLLSDLPCFQISPDSSTQRTGPCDPAFPSLSPSVTPNHVWLPRPDVLNVLCHLCPHFSWNTAPPASAGKCPSYPSRFHPGITCSQKLPLSHTPFCSCVSHASPGHKLLQSTQGMVPRLPLYWCSPQD